MTELFSFTESAGAMHIVSAGHGEFDHIEVQENDGTIASPVDMTSNKKLYIRLKASVPMAMRISLIDINGVEAGNNNLPAVFDKQISTSWQIFSVDYTGNLVGTWFSQGNLDVTKISKIALRPNPAFASNPIFGYTSAFKGTIDVDWVVLGDTTGCWGSTVTGIEELSQKVSLKVQPNPFGDEATLIINGGNNEMANIIIYDLSGREVFNDNMKIQNNQLYIGKDLQTGMYLVQITQNNQTQTVKIVKQ